MAAHHILMTYYMVKKFLGLESLVYKPLESHCKQNRVYMVILKESIVFIRFSSKGLLNA